MTFTLEGWGVVLAFAIAGVSAGSWGAFITFQVRALRREVCNLHRTVLTQQPTIRL